MLLNGMGTQCFHEEYLIFFLSLKANLVAHFYLFTQSLGHSHKLTKLKITPKHFHSSHQS